MQTMDPQAERYYKERIEPNLKKIARLSKRGKTKQQIAKRLGIDYQTLLKHCKARPELNDLFMNGLTANSERVAVSLVQAATGYKYKEKEILYDGVGDIVQVKVKEKYNPPNVGAAIRVLKMIEDYYGVDEQLKAAQVRNVTADAELKEKALEDLRGGKDVVPIVSILENLRTLGGGDNGAS